MRKSRPKRHIRWTPLVALLLAGNVIAGVLYSPITSIRRLRIEGALPFDRDRLAALAPNLQGVACAQVKARNLESLALQSGEMRTAELTRSPFGSAVLRVGYRRPIARFFARPNLALSIDGVIFPTQQGLEGLPLIKAEDSQPETALTIAGTVRWTGVAALAVKAQKMLPEEEFRIDVEPGGNLCLNIKVGRVILGTCDNLDAKLLALRENIASTPTWPPGAIALNLTSPNQPVFVNLKKRPQ